MSINGQRRITGLSHSVANDGIPVASMPLISGGNGVVTDFSVIWTGLGLPPSDPLITIQGFPFPGSGATANGTDSLGQIAVLKTFTGTGNDREFMTSDGLVTLTDGFWAGLIRAFINNVTGTRNFSVDWSALDINDPLDWPGGSPPNTPTNLGSANESWDPVEEQGTADISWDIPAPADESGFAIIRDGLLVGTVPSGVNTFTDYVDALGTYEYTIRGYKYPNSLGAASLPLSVVFGGSLPDISITGSGGIDFGGGADFVFIGDPSGIYTLVVDKTHDTLYERTDVDFVDVKIPDPFIKTAFLGE